MNTQPREPLEQRPIVLVEASRQLGAWTRYEDQIFSASAAELDVRFVSRPTDLAGVDVLHTAEDLSGLLGVGQQSDSATWLRAAQQFVGLLEKSNTRFVRTIFDEQTVASDSPAREATQLLNEVTSVFITVDASSPTPDASRTVTIPYADFAPRFEGYPRAQKVAGRVVALASEYATSAAEGLLKTSFVSRTRGASFRIVGVLDDALRALLKARMRGGQHNLSARPEVLSDAGLIEEITAGELIVVPHTKTLRELHLLMLALSMSRPVLVQSSPLTESLRSQIGERWVVTYAGELTAKHIDDAIYVVRAPEEEQALSLDDRGWAATGRRYLDVFRKAASANVEVAA